MQSALGVEPGALCFGGEYLRGRYSEYSIGRFKVKQFLGSWCYTRPHELRVRSRGFAAQAGAVGAGVRGAPVAGVGHAAAGGAVQRGAAVGL